MFKNIQTPPNLRLLKSVMEPIQKANSNNELKHFVGFKQQACRDIPTAKMGEGGLTFPNVALRSTKLPTTLKNT